MPDQFYGPDFLQGSITSKLFGMDPSTAAYKNDLSAKYNAQLPPGADPFAITDPSKPAASGNPAPGAVSGEPAAPGPAVGGLPAGGPPAGSIPKKGPATGGAPASGTPDPMTGMPGTLHAFEGEAPWTAGMSDDQVLQQLRTITQQDFDAYKPIQEARIADLITGARPDLRTRPAAPDQIRDNPVFGEAMSGGTPGTDVIQSIANPIARPPDGTPFFPPTGTPTSGNPIARPGGSPTPKPGSGAPGGNTPTPGNPIARPGGVNKRTTVTPAAAIPAGWNVVEYPFPSSSNEWKVTVR